MFSLAKFIALGAKSGISKDLLVNAICRHCVFLSSKMQEYHYFVKLYAVCGNKNYGGTFDRS